MALLIHALAAGGLAAIGHAPRPAARRAWLPGVPDPAPVAPPGLSGDVNTLLAWWKWGALVAGDLRAGRLRRDDGDRPPQPLQPGRRRRDRDPVGAGRADADCPVVGHRRRLHVRPAMCYPRTHGAGAGAAGSAGAAGLTVPLTGHRSSPLVGSLAHEARHAQPHQRQPRPATTPAPRPSPATASAGHQPRRPPRSKPTPAQGLTWVSFHGMQLPVSATAGPRDTRGGLASGFADTPQGALLAAINIGVRTAAQWGSAIFVPTITRQVTGPDTTALLHAEETAYAQLRAAAHVRAGQPAGQGYAAEDGYRFAGLVPGRRDRRRRHRRPSRQRHHGAGQPPGSRSCGGAVTGGWWPRPAATGPTRPPPSPPCSATRSSPAKVTAVHCDTLVEPACAIVSRVVTSAASSAASDVLSGLANAISDGRALDGDEHGRLVDQHPVPGPGGRARDHPNPGLAAADHRRGRRRRDDRGRARGW